MPIKPYFPASPPLKTTHFGLPPQRISALIIEEDLSDLDTSDSSWFLPANVYETVTISQKQVPESPKPHFSNLATGVDTSRRPSIALARLQTKGLDDVDIKLPNYDYATSQGSLNAGHKRRRDSTSSDVFFHSPLQRCKTYSDSDSTSSMSTSSSASPRSSSHSTIHSDPSVMKGFDSPVFYPESDCDCDCACIDDQDEWDGKAVEEESALDEGEISKSASSLPIEVPKRNASLASRKRRGCFVQEDVVQEDEDWEENEDNETTDDFEESVEYWVQFAYTPTTNFETALISEVVRRRKSDEHFSRLKNSPGSEKELENAQFSETHRRSKWMKDMVRWYPQESGGGHMLPCF